MGDLTLNFSVHEFRCRCNGKFCDGTALMSPSFMERLQRLRTFYGRPIIIESGIRCPEWNRLQKGAKDSWHLKGRAVDIQCGWGTDRHRLLELAFMLQFGGVGIAKTFIHLDDRPPEDATTWGYW